MYKIEIWKYLDENDLPQSQIVVDGERTFKCDWMEDALFLLDCLKAAGHEVEYPKETA